MHTDTRNLAYVYKGQATQIPHVSGDFCDACNEIVLARVEGDRYSRLIADFQREINATFIDPTYITRVRKKLDLDQRQAADIFGGGVNAFSRYENGKTKPPQALVQLLKLLDQPPELLAEISQP